MKVTQTGKLFSESCMDALTNVLARFFEVQGITHAPTETAWLAKSTTGSVVRLFMALDQDTWHKYYRVAEDQKQALAMAVKNIVIIDLNCKIELELKHVSSTSDESL